MLGASKNIIAKSRYSFSLLIFYYFRGLFFSPVFLLLMHFLLKRYFFWRFLLRLFSLFYLAKKFGNKIMFFEIIL